MPRKTRDGTERDRGNIAKGSEEGGGGIGERKGWRSENDDREIEGREKRLGKESSVADDVDLVDRSSGKIIPPYICPCERVN